VERQRLVGFIDAAVFVGEPPIILRQLAGGFRLREPLGLVVTARE
jgi:hypothetical protein